VRGVERIGARHRVVSVGGGFGGLPAARILGFADVDVVLFSAGHTGGDISVPGEVRGTRQ